MTTDTEYTDMEICPECLMGEYDGISCERCGHVNIPTPPKGEYNYMEHADGD